MFINNIITVFNEYNELEKNQRIGSLQKVGNDIKIGDTSFKNFGDFANFVHAAQSKYANSLSTTVVSKDDLDMESIDEPLWSGNNIDIFDAADVGKCIKYSQGGLTGKAYSFCIGAFGNTLYQSYRDSKTSTFYFIVDKNKIKTLENGQLDMSDPLHMVVFDRTNYGVELTDQNNDTGTIAEYGKNPEGYIKYLKSKGVPVDELLINRPKTKDEEYEDELLGQPNSDLQWFIDLPFEYKSKYIGRGHVLTDEQFDYLIG